MVGLERLSHYQRNLKSNIEYMNMQSKINMMLMRKNDTIKEMKKME